MSQPTDSASLSNRVFTDMIYHEVMQMDTDTWSDYQAQALQHLMQFKQEYRRKRQLQQQQQQQQQLQQQQQYHPYVPHVPQQQQFILLQALRPPLLGRCSLVILSALLPRCSRILPALLPRCSLLHPALRPKRTRCLPLRLCLHRPPLLRYLRRSSVRHG